MNDDAEDTKLGDLFYGTQGNDNGGNDRDQAGSEPLPQATQRDRRWRLEWAGVRGCASDGDPNVKQKPKAGEGKEGVSDGVVDGCHVPTEAAGEEKKCDLEHHRETLDEQVEWPFGEPVALPLTISATVDHGSSGVPQVSI